jgi:hypothetical protein
MNCIHSDSAHENQTYVNWVFGHGVTPKIGKRATASQSKFDRARTAARGFGLWLTYNGTDEELKE